MDEEQNMGVNGHIKYFDHREEIFSSEYGCVFASPANDAKFSLGSILGVKTVRLE